MRLSISLQWQSEGEGEEGEEGERMMCSMNWACQLMVLESLGLPGCQRPGVNAVRTDIGGWET